MRDISKTGNITLVIPGVPYFTCSCGHIHYKKCYICKEKIMGKHSKGRKQDKVSKPAKKNDITKNVSITPPRNMGESKQVRDAYDKLQKKKRDNDR